MKILKTLTIFTIILFSISSCKKDNNEEETNSEARIIRLDNSIGEIAPKSIYMPSNDFQVTSYFKFDSQGNIERLSHLVGDDGSGMSTVISFNENGDINTIYQQDATSGSLSNVSYLKYENGTLYYGTEDDTSQTDNSSSLNSNDFIENTNDDILLSNMLSQNINILEHIKFLSENSNKSSQAQKNAFLAAVVIIAIVKAMADWVIEESDVTNCILSTDTCNNRNRSSSSSQNNSCTPNYSQFICSNEDLVSEMLEESTNMNVDLCNGELCITNTIDLSGEWIMPINCGSSNQIIRFNQDGTYYNETYPGLISSAYTIENNLLNLNAVFIKNFSPYCGSFQVKETETISLLYNESKDEFNGSDIATNEFYSGDLNCFNQIDPWASVTCNITLRRY